MPFCFEFVKHFDCVGHTAFERVVRVNQKQTIVGIDFGVFFKRFQLAVKGHNPTVRVRTGDGNTEKFARNYVGCGTATADASGSCAVNTRICALRSAQSELAYLVLGALFEARGFGCNQRLVIDKSQ